MALWCIYVCIEETIDRNIGEFRYFEYLEEKSLMNSLIRQIDSKDSINLREKTLVV